MKVALLILLALFLASAAYCQSSYELIVMTWDNDGYNVPGRPNPQVPGVAFYTARNLTIIPTVSLAECQRLENTLRWAKGCFAFDEGTDCGGMPTVKGGPNNIKANGFWIVGCFQMQ